jgi:C4-dicarboxylate-specific signal transduction histidine kinase
MTCGSSWRLLSTSPRATKFAVDPAATPVLVDRVQIQQVLVNLMRNAIEAMAECPVLR